ncbi:hypothetical protein [Streptomyces sp. NBC_00140]|uniref:hypothetical protein n=1 Tax=Streptomyces sp. NBC_00140 TaxID=2975664 RepID=UPI002258AAE4|nr:hypothetical protein [Streptomyces sp. NBC_00140]MCX5328449.1 hypothetical protein [Streptomyces sp. NBC_00140]
MNVAVELLTTALVIVVALLASVGAAALARLDGATYPAVLKQAASAFATVIALAVAAIAVLT